MLKPLPRVRDLAEFRERFFLKHAVIVEGAAKGMAASGWTPSFLSETLANQRPTVRLANGRLAHMGMQDFFRYFEASDSVESSHGPIYLTDFFLKPSFGDAEREQLGSEVRYPLVDPDEWPEWKARHTGWNTLYAGAAGTYTRVHVDPFSTTSWLAAIAGTKEWRLCEPEAVIEEVALKTNPFVDSPLPCAFFEAVQEPGDVMYIPPNWWHAVRNATATIAVTGNVCTVEHARASFAEVKEMAESSERDVWMKTWTAVLERVELERTAST